jgi:hypothetical protein
MKRNPADAIMARMEQRELQGEDLRRIFRQLPADSPLRVEFQRRLEVSSAIWSELADLFVELRGADD